MTWAEEDLRRAKSAYDAAVNRWYAARDAGDLVSEEDEYERSAGVRWKAVTPKGKVVLSAFQVAKANLDHYANRVRREAGDERCPECEGISVPARKGRPELALVEQDRRLPPEHDDGDEAQT
jgi:hypothetical protein